MPNIRLPEIEKSQHVATPRPQLQHPGEPVENTVPWRRDKLIAVYGSPSEDGSKTPDRSLINDLKSLHGRSSDFGQIVNDIQREYRLRLPSPK